jgi:hypothetical protein
VRRNQLEISIGRGRWAFLYGLNPIKLFGWKERCNVGDAIGRDENRRILFEGNAAVEWSVAGEEELKKGEIRWKLAFLRVDLLLVFY